MLKTPTIAVVIPNRNDSKYLKKCLYSVLSQDIPPDQIVVVDDQSTDDSVNIIREKLQNVPCASVIVNPICLGTMSVLNEGLKHVTSEYVLFLSSNDYIEDGIFAHAKSQIVATDSPGVWSAMVWEVDENGRPLHLYPSPVVALSDTFLTPDKCIRLAHTVGHWFTGTTLIYHRETLQKIGGFDTAFQGLADMLAALTVASIKGASFSPKPFGVMRRHGDGLYWRTITNLPGLDIILEKMEHTGYQLSPALFTSKFCDVMNRRIRFSAIRASHDNNWQIHALSWKGYRYRFLSAISHVFSRHRKLQLAFAFLVLRPFADIIAIIWYRMLGTLMIIAHKRRPRP